MVLSTLRRIFCALLFCSSLGPFECIALERDVVISVYQGPCKDGDFPANLKAARDAVQEALSRNSDFLVLPETFLSGYDSLEHMRLGARRIEDPEINSFIAESSKYPMVVLVGLARLTDEGIYNTVLVIHQGKLLGMYDKIMLTEGDRDDLRFLPGKDVPVFSANGAKFAVIICHDTSFPHPALLAKLKGAEILFTPHYNSINPQTMDAHRRWVRNCHIGLACQMKMVVARANVVVTGNPKELGYGDSFILSPQGEMLAEAELFRTEMITARVKPSLFAAPVVWADLKEVPAELKARLAEVLTEGARR